MNVQNQQTFPANRLLRLGLPSFQAVSRLRYLSFAVLYSPCSILLNPNCWLVRSVYFELYISIVGAPVQIPLRLWLGHAEWHLYSNQPQSIAEARQADESCIPQQERQSLHTGPALLW